MGAMEVIMQAMEAMEVAMVMEVVMAKAMEA